MPNPEWGVKRACPHCATRFYDLASDPATCPSCGNRYSLDALTLKRARPDRVEPKATTAAGLARAPVADEDDILVVDEEGAAAEEAGVADEILENDEDADAVPLDEIGDRPADEHEP
jgi:uncharacterized protein (TIGR02300 family)